MKKNISIIISGITLLGIITFIGISNFYLNKKIVLENEHINKEYKTMGMMYETEAGSGIYTSTANAELLEDGYKFNNDLSTCENGSKLSWDEGNKKVILKSNISEKCYLFFDIKATTIAADYITNLYNEQADSSLYLHDADLENGAGDNSLRYSGGDYQLTIKATGGGYTSLVTATADETNGIIDFYCNEEKKYVGYSCDASYSHYYTVAGGSTQYTTYDDALEGGVTEGFLTKDNVKNFLCFGTNEIPCPENNLYRIIGVFGNQVKIIKYDYARIDILGTDGNYYDSSADNFYSGKKGTEQTNIDRYRWVTNNVNTWSTSTLNTINLNTNFINNIGELWAQKIATVTWQTGGNDYTLIKENVTNVYQNEIVNPSTDAPYEDKIGLIYVSDYMYAASPNNWTYLGYGSATTDYRAIKGDNWMYMGQYEFTITPRTDVTNIVFSISCEGSISYFSISFSNVRPTFYLNPDVGITGGTGIKTDPYRIAD